MENQSCCLPSLWGGGRSTNPSSHQSSSFIDESDIARELNELSFAEREKAMDDLHGVSKAQEETPEFVDKCITEMDDTIDAIPLRKKRDYSRALFLWPGLKNDTKFKLRFLRADSYDARKAAHRMVCYYTEKRKLFGEAKLVKTITIDDLDEKELEEFSSGGTMQLPITDQSGRPIDFCDTLHSADLKLSIDNTLRTFWYNVMTLFDDETAQMKGAVCVFRICFDPASLLNPAWLRNQLALQNRIGEILNSCLPGRYSSYHLCIDSPSLGIIVSSLRLAMGKNTRLRLRVHMGSDIENEYSLMSYGIPVDGVLRKTREGCTDLHMKFIQRRREIDRQKMENEFQECIRTDFVPFPIQSDVLFGRGRPYREFPGNDAWNAVIADHCDRFRSGNSQFEKTCVTMEVVKKVRNGSDIRFLLESTDGGWKMIHDDVCLRGKASSALQNRIKALSKMESHCEEGGGGGTPAKRRRCEGRKNAKEAPFELLRL